MHNIGDYLRSFLGLNSRDYGTNNDGFHNEFRNPIWNVDDDDDTDDELHHRFDRQDRNMFPGGSFNIFSDPLEMAKYAEQQMERMMGLFNEMFDLQFGNNFATPHDFPALLPESSIEAPSKSIRDEYLKPGYSKSSSNKVDSDLDNELSQKDLGSILDNFDQLQIKDKPKTDLNDELPNKMSPGFNNHFYFKQIVTRTITRPDGTVETTRTIKNSDGTEETTSIVTQDNGKRILTDIPPNFPNDSFPLRKGFWSNIFGF